MSFDIIENLKVVKGRQDVICKGLFKHKESGIKVRISVRSDSYQFQSHAYLEAFSPTEQKWNRVVSLHFSEMTTVEGVIYMPAFQGNKPVPVGAVSHFSDDVNSLLNQYDNLMK